MWPHAFTNLHAFVSTSKYLNETAWHECFHSKNFPVLGYSRNDILFREARPFELLNTDQSIFQRLQAEKDSGVKLVITRQLSEIMARIILIDWISTFQSWTAFAVRMAYSFA